MQTIAAIENLSPGLRVKRFLNTEKTEKLPTPLVYGMHKKNN